MAQTVLAILFYNASEVNHIFPNVNAIISSMVDTTADLFSARPILNKRVG